MNYDAEAFDRFDSGTIAHALGTIARSKDFSETARHASMSHEGLD